MTEMLGSIRFGITFGVCREREDGSPYIPLFLNGTEIGCIHAEEYEGPWHCGELAYTRKSYGSDDCGYHLIRRVAREYAAELQIIENNGEIIAA